MTDTVAGPTLAEMATARRNAFLLAGAAAFSGAIPTIAIGTGGLTGAYLLGAEGPAIALDTACSASLAGGRLNGVKTTASSSMAKAIDETNVSATVSDRGA